MPNTEGYDGEEHGTEDFETAFAESCNSAFANLGMELGPSLGRIFFM